MKRLYLYLWDGWAAETLRVTTVALLFVGVWWLGWWTLAVTIPIYLGTLPFEARLARNYRRSWPKSDRGDHRE